MKRAIIHTTCSATVLLGNACKQNYIYTIQFPVATHGIIILKNLEPHLM